MKVYYISINYSVEDELGSSKFWVQQNIFIVSWCTGLVLRLSSTDLSQSFLCKVLPIYMYIRLCHLFMFDQAYYRSSILSMSLCIVSFLKKIGQQGCIYRVYYGKLFVCFCIHQSVRYMFFCKKEDVLNINVHGLPL